MDRSNYDAIYSCRICFRGLSTAGSPDPSNPEFFISNCGHIVCSVHIFPGGGFGYFYFLDSIALYLQIPLLLLAPENLPDTKHTCPYCSRQNVTMVELSRDKVRLSAT